MALQMALLAAPLVVQGLQTIFSIGKSRKAKKETAAGIASLTADTQQRAQAMQGQTAKVLGSINGGYMGPSGTPAGQGGVPTMQPGQLPGFAQAS